MRQMCVSKNNNNYNAAKCAWECVSVYRNEPCPVVAVVFGNLSGSLPVRSAVSEDPWRDAASCQQVACVVVCARRFSQLVAPARLLLFRRPVAQCSRTGCCQHCGCFLLARWESWVLDSIVFPSGSLSGSSADVVDVRGACVAANTFWGGGEGRREEEGGFLFVWMINLSIRRYVSLESLLKCPV